MDQKTAFYIEKAQIGRRIAYIDALSKLQPGSGTRWQSIGDGVAICAGKGSPVNRAIGLGLTREVREEDILAVERFLASAGAAWVDVCPYAHESLLKQLSKNGYAIAQFDDVLFREVGTGIDLSGHQPLEVTVIEGSKRESWIDVIAASFGADGSDYQTNRGIALPSAYSKDFTCFLAYCDGEIAGAGGLYLREGLAEFAPDGVLPPFRGRGVQAALTAYRLAYASSHGCRVAVTTCEPGSPTRRNAEKSGFRLAYTKPVAVKVKRQ